MRCPKCSFTSFDHLVTCEKCGRDLTEIVGQLHGTSLKAESPFFLGPAMQTPAAEETFDVSGGTEDVGLGMDQEADFAQAAETGAAEPFADEEIDLEREPDKAEAEPAPAATVPDKDEVKLQMEGAAEETDEEIKPETESAGGDESLQSAAEKPGPVGKAVEEQTGSASLNFEGLDLSDLSPADAPGSEGDESGEEERPLDLWSLDTSGEDDLADLFDDLIPAGKAKKEATATDEQAAAAERTDADAPAETATAADDQPEKDDS